MIELCYLKQGLGGNVTALFLFISPSWFSHSFFQNPWCGLKSPRNRFGFYLSVLFCLCVFFHFSSSEYLSFPQTALKHVILFKTVYRVSLHELKLKELESNTSELFRQVAFFSLGLEMIEYLIIYLIIFYLPMKFLLSKGCDRITES